VHEDIDATRGVPGSPFLPVVMTLHRLAAGAGYRYLMKAIASGEFGHGRAGAGQAHTGSGHEPAHQRRIQQAEQA